MISQTQKAYNDVYTDIHSAIWTPRSVRRIGTIVQAAVLYSAWVALYDKHLNDYDIDANGIMYSIAHNLN